MKIRNYTENQIEYIKNNYLTKSTKEIAKHIGKTENQVTFVATRKLGLMKQVHNKWTDSEIEYLKNHYIDMTSEEISKHIKHSVHAINTQRDRLGLIRDLPWNDDDIEFLKQNYKSKTHEEIGRILHRTTQAITAKCFDLNLYKKEIPWTERDYQFIRDNYMKMQTSEIAEYLHRSSAAVKIKAKQIGLKKYPYCCDYHYFDNIDTEEKAYWLGFLSADGWIWKPNDSGAGVVGCELQYRDINHLKKLNKSISGNYKITDRWRHCNLSKSNKLSHMCCLRIYSFQMYDSFVNIGFTNQKSFDCDIPKLTDELLRHFIRGYFDGNGLFSFNPQKDGFTVGFTTASQKLYSSFLSIFKKLNFELYDRSYISEYGTNIYCFNIRFKDNKIRFLQYIYDNCSIYLDRKYKKYLNVINYYNQHDGLAC